MHTRSGLAALLGAGLLAAIGCQSEPATVDDAPAAPVPWSTKDQSVLGRAEATPRLTMPRRFEAFEGPRLRETAANALVQASVSPDPLMRANAMEALEPAPEHLPEILLRGVNDENRGVRFVATVMVGRVRMQSLLPEARENLFDGSASVRAAAIYAAHQCGEPADPTPLGAMVMSDDPEVKANAAMVLGALGDPTAIPMLKEAVHQRIPRVPVARERIVDLQIAEAMVKLGADEELEAIRAALFAPDEHGELTILACQILGRVHDRAYGTTLFDMAMRTGPPDEKAPEIRLAAIEALARMDPTRVPVDMPMSFLASERPEIRAQAAAVLGWIGDPSVLPSLAAVLDDGNPYVQVAAAGAILRVRDR